MEDWQATSSTFAEPGSSDDAPDRWLTTREMQVLRLVVRGKKNREIAVELGISPNTVDRHVSRILVKTGTANRAQAAAYAVQSGLVA